MKRIPQLALAAIAILMLHSGCSNSPVSSSGADQLVTTDTNPANDVSFTAPIASIAQATGTLTLVGRSTEFRLSPTADLLAQDGGRSRTIELHELSVGDMVDIKGDFESGTVIADWINKRSSGTNDDSSDTEYAGHVIFVDPANNQFALNTCWLVKVNGATEIVRKISGVETPITLADISFGDSVEVKGALQEDFSLLAERVRVRVAGDDDEDEDELTSFISEIDYLNETFRLGGRSELFTTDDATIILAKMRKAKTDNASSNDDDGNDDDSTKYETIPFSDLLAGDTVEVHFVMQDDSTALATSIKVEDGVLDDEDEGEDDDELNEEKEIKSTLLFVDTASNSVGFSSGCSFGFVLPNADLRDDDGGAITLGDFAAGMFVEAKGYIDSTGVFQIVRMEIEEAND